MLVGKNQVELTEQELHEMEHDPARQVIDGVIRTRVIEARNLERSFNRAQAFWDAHSKWSQETFGTDQERGPLGALKHLEKEAREAQTEVQVGMDASPALREEIADCLFLTCDAARRAGMTLNDLLDEANKKLEINKTRTWAKPTKADEPVEHVRSNDGPGDIEMGNLVR